MKASLLIVLGALLIAAVPVAADHPTGATMEDLRDLQYDLELLDDSLAAVPAGHPRERQFRDRADDIGDRVRTLETAIRRHQRTGGTGFGASVDDVRALERMAATLQNDIDAALDRRFTGEVTLPAGTEIPVRLEQSLSSETARVEDRVEATVAESVTWDGRVVLPVGTPVRGVVSLVEEAERPARGGKLDIDFDSVWMDDRVRTDLRADIVSIRPGIDRSDSAKRAGIGAILGGVLGSILGGTEATIIGAVLGAGGAIAASAGEEVELPAGSVLTLRLERPLSVRR